jgi:hypothetical protein
MKRDEPPLTRTWKEQSASFIVAFFCLLYGGLHVKAGVIGWRNYQNQPVTVHLILALGVVLVVIGLLDIFLWNPQRRREHKGQGGRSPRGKRPHGQ